MRADEGGPGGDEGRDPGLARERTELAWNRTAVSFIALGAAIVKSRPPAGLVVLAMGALVFILAHRSRPGSGRRRPLLLITATVTAVAAAALTLALLSPG